ncbi:25723_t:CDS:2, partial [Gigaspora rosea]
IMSPNPFSKAIPCRPGNPIHLLNFMSLDEYGAILLDEQALRILRKIEEPIAVITLAPIEEGNHILQILFLDAMMDLNLVHQWMDAQNASIFGIPHSTMKAN